MHTSRSAESTIMHMHSGHGQWAWLRLPTNYTIKFCDTCRPCHSILSILKPFFDRFTALTYRSGALISRFGNICVHSNANDDSKRPLTKHG